MAAEVDGSGLDPMAPTAISIEDRWDETHDTFTLRMRPPLGFDFSPGQFDMLYAFGIGEVAISISGDPASSDALLHTIRGVGAVTKALRGLEPGDVVGIRGPFGNPWPVELAAGHDVVFVAGGIGLAPVRSAIYHVLGHRDAYGRIALIYGARSPADLVYRTEIQEWRSRLDMHVLVTVDTADRRWKGSVGVVTKLIGRAPFDPYNTVAFVCGPEVMMQFTARQLTSRGVGPSMIFLSMERNMKCAVGVCGHCQYGPRFVCRDGPVLRYDEIAGLSEIREM